MRDHDDNPGVLLPDHPPESGKRSLDGSLSCDVGPRLPEPVDEVGVEVFLLVAVEGVQVAASHPGSESNPGVVIWNRKKYHRSALCSSDRSAELCLVNVTAKHCE